MLLAKLTVSNGGRIGARKRNDRNPGVSWSVRKGYGFVVLDLILI